MENKIKKKLPEIQEEPQRLESLGESAGGKWEAWRDSKVKVKLCVNESSSKGHHAISEQPRRRKSKKTLHGSSSRRLSNPPSPSTVGKTCWTEKTCVGNRAHSLILETSSAITLFKKSVFTFILCV